MIDESLIDAIYEAGAMPDRWEPLLDRIAHRFGAKGGNVMASTPQWQINISSPGIIDISRAFYEQGWAAQNTRISRYVARPPYAGFLTDLDLHTEEELRTLPMYRDFLVPLGGDAGAATLVQGVSDDSLAITIEGFPGHAAAREALATLDALRPHLARAVTLSGRLQLERIRAAVAALELIGTPAAMLDSGGRVQIANPRFEKAIGGLFLDRRKRLHMTDEGSARLLEHAMLRLLTIRQGSSIPVRSADAGPSVLHLIPVHGDARDIFSNSAGFVLLADPSERSVPDAGLLQTLFDLTPAEARIARTIAEGTGIGSAAEGAGLSVETVRSHLKAIFLKTGTSRQSELSALLHRYS